VRDIIETDVTLSESLLPLLNARLVLYHCFRKLDNRTRHMAHADLVCQLLMSAPGVGFVTALTYKAGVDEPTRFKHSRTVAARSVLPPDASSRVRSTSKVTSPDVVTGMCAAHSIRLPMP
jgi:transposase